MNEIKRIVNELHIPKKREEYFKRREDLIKYRATLKALAADEEVAEYLRLLNSSYDDPEEDKLVSSNLRLMARTSDNIEMYKDLNLLLLTWTSITNYQKTIQVNLRRRLTELKLPDIYVYPGLVGKGNKALYRHIIDPANTKEFVSEGWTVVAPTKERTSNRQVNQFYWRTSYRYLEALTRDYSFDIEGKDLGPALIKK